MISIDGASLIAQVFPVLILLLGVEIRAMTALFFEGAPNTTFQRRLRYAFVGTALIGVILGMGAEFGCILCVSIEQPVTGFFVPLVWAAGIALALGTILFISTSVATAITATSS